MRVGEHQTQSDQLSRLLARMPASTRDSFSEVQLQALREALISQSRHTIDTRPVVKIPLLPWSFYLVLLAGKNRRTLSDREQRVASKTLITLLITAIVVLSLLGVIVLYLIKSALGIDIIKNFHWGIWTWFSEVILKQ